MFTNWQLEAQNKISHRNSVTNGDYSSRVGPMAYFYPQCNWTEKPRGVLMAYLVCQASDSWFWLKVLGSAPNLALFSLGSLREILSPSLFLYPHPIYPSLPISKNKSWKKILNLNNYTNSMENYIPSIFLHQAYW